jgi:UDP-N-acetylglucosamine pyrophosphorylase
MSTERTPGQLDFTLTPNITNINYCFTPLVTMEHESSWTYKDFQRCNCSVGNILANWMARILPSVLVSLHVVFRYCRFRTTLVCGVLGFEDCPP